MLAGEVAAAGCSVLVLEQAASPTLPLKEPPFGLRGLSVPTVEAFELRGLAAPLRQRTVERAGLEPRPLGHFAGIDFFPEQVAPSAWGRRTPGAVMPLAADMASVEAVLADRAAALGVTILYGYTVESFEQDDRGVRLSAGGKRVDAQWLAGCDGGRSTVRKLAGIAFPGTAPEFTGYSVRAVLGDGAVLTPGCTPIDGGVCIHAPPDALWLAEWDGGAAHRTVPLDREHIEAVLRRVSGTDVTLTDLHLATTWTDRACQAATCRADRVLLAGDAAHIHSPLGGQGLNLGIGDAVVLGRALVAVVRGGAGAGHLDSYEAERRPVVSDVLKRSRAQVALLRPDAGWRSLERIMRDLIATRDGATYFAERVAGIGTSYIAIMSGPIIDRCARTFSADRSGHLALYELQHEVVGFADCGVFVMIDRTKRVAWR
jgi:2-polyprenyl-6-methoxyphenol hydroxylase-like FAD-dependent oxidoreductase